MISSKIGVSAIHVQREMGLGSYQTAWAMLHRYRSVMVRPGRDRLTGDVEVDESYLGGPETGVAGRGALGKDPESHQPPLSECFARTPCRRVP